MSEFKKQIVIQWFPKDWLSDPDVRALSPAAKGFWADFLNQMAMFFPYGHCTILNMKKLREVTEKDRALKKILASVDVGVKGGVNPDPNQEDKLWVQLSLYVPVDVTLQFVDNVEGYLHKFLPFEASEIPGYIQECEERNVFSRTPEGIIYGRRLVRDFRKRVNSYLNGVKGGNPYLKNGKSVVGKGLSKAESRDNGGVNPPLNRWDNPDGQNSVNPPYGYGSGSNSGYSEGVNGSKEGGSGETIQGNEGEPFFPFQFLYDMPYDKISKLANVGKGITEAEFAVWKRFVDMIREKKFYDLYKARFINPVDFTNLVRVDLFTEEKWEPVIRKLLSTGVRAEHNLYFRIPEFIKIVYNKRKTNGLDSGGEGFEGQESW